MLSSLTETTWRDSGDCALERRGIHRLATSNQLIRSLVLMALSPTARFASECNNFTQYLSERNNIVTMHALMLALHPCYGCPPGLQPLAHYLIGPTQIGGANWMLNLLFAPWTPQAP